MTTDVTGSNAPRTAVAVEPTSFIAAAMVDTDISDGNRARASVTAHSPPVVRGCTSVQNLVAIT